MQAFNIFDPTFEYDPTDPDGYHAGMDRFGPKIGATRMGASVYELPPGQALCPYHYEYGEEEWVLVLEGRPGLRTPEGTRTLEPFDIAFFPRGPAGAHQLRNDGDEPVRLLMFSDVVYPSATAYPDSDKVGIWTGVEGENLMAERSSDVPYVHGE